MFYIPQCVTEKAQFALLSRHKMGTTIQRTKSLHHLEKNFLKWYKIQATK